MGYRDTVSISPCGILGVFGVAVRGIWGLVFVLRGRLDNQVIRVSLLLIVLIILAGQCARSAKAQMPILYTDTYLPSIFGRFVSVAFPPDIPIAALEKPADR